MNHSHVELEKRIVELEAELARSSRYAKINHALVKIADSVSSSASLGDLFPNIHRSLATVIDTTNFYVALYDELRHCLTFPYHVDEISDKVCFVEMKPGSGRDSLTDRVFATRQTVLFSKEEILKERAATGWQVIRGHVPESFLGVPLLAREKLIGVMAVQSYDGHHHYDQTDVEIMMIVAAQVAIAIDRKQLEARLIDSLGRFRRILEDVAEISIQGYDEERRVTFWNSASTRLYGYSAQEALGKKLEDLIIPAALRQQAIRSVERWLDAGEIVPPGELVLRDKQGRDVPVFSTHVMYEGLTGKEMYCIDLDLRPIKQAEESLRAANAKFQAAMESLDAVVYAADMDTYELLFLNSKAAGVFGARTGERCWKALQVGQEGPCPFCTNNRLLRDDGTPTEPYVWEVQNSKTGRWYLCRDQAVRWPDGRLVRLEIAVDITDRKAMEVSLRDSEERFRALHDASFGGICIHDQGKIIECNNSFVEMSGYSREELIGANGFQMITEEYRQEMYQKTIDDYTDPYFVQGRRKDGTLIDIRVQGKKIPYKGRTVRVAELNDVTLTRSAERALAESEQKLRVIFENSPLGIIYFDDEGTINECNQPFIDMMGTDRSKLIGFNTARQSSPAMQEAIKKALAGEKSTYEDVYTSVTGNKTSFLRVNFNPVTPGINPSKVIATLEDISARKAAEQERLKLEEQLQQAQKLESIGRLAGGVAHDFNNMLGVIIGRAEMVLDETDPAFVWHEDLQEIHRAASRSADLTRQLLAFARKQTIIPQVLNLCDKVEEIFSMLRRLIGEDVDLSWESQGEIWKVRIDPAQVDQILTNLTVNGRDAITGTGKILIALRNVYVVEDYETVAAGGRAGDFVELSVTDDGCGMDEQVKENLFEPFFTTKSVGKGTGLGLATVYGIVRQNQGFVKVRTAPNEGSTFSVYLPRCQAALSVQEADGELVKMPSAGDITVLLVEDEAAMLKLTRAMLQRLGYRVIAAKSPGEAVRLAAEYGGPIDILLTDVIMPEMDGQRLAENIVTLYPGVRILFMSGYTDDIILGRGALEEGVAFIQKPFTKKALANKLQDLFPAD